MTQSCASSSGPNQAPTWDTYSVPKAGPILSLPWAASDHDWPWGGHHQSPALHPKLLQLGQVPHFTPVSSALGPQRVCLSLTCDQIQRGET